MGLMLGKGRRIAKTLRPGLKGSLDFRPCTTLHQQRGSAEWCTTLRTCTMGPIVECGFCSACLKETMGESTASLPPPLAAESQQSVVYLCISYQSRQWFAEVRKIKQPRTGSTRQKTAVPKPPSQVLYMLPPRRDRDAAGGGCGWTCSGGGRGRRATPHQHAGATRAPKVWGPRPT